MSKHHNRSRRSIGRDCDCNDLTGSGLTRRDFLSTLGLLAGGAMVPGFIRDLVAAEAQDPAKARTVILLWLGGGPSQIDTFDPKPGTATGGSFKALETAIPGLFFSEHLPRLAAAANRLAVIRSMTSKEGNHDRARYFVHTGYVPQGTVQHPSVGSIVAHELGGQETDIPPFVAIGSPSVGSGYLGAESAPFVVRDPKRPVDNLAYSGGVDRERFTERLKLLRPFEDDFAESVPEEMVSARRTVYRRAIRMMHGDSAKAFDLTREDDATKSRYGTSTFGQGCLMARRLVESGSRFVEVSLEGWDTHQDGSNRIATLSKSLDEGFSALVEDLAQRDLLGSTLVLCLGEFGRSPDINSTDGRGHYPKAWSAVLAGGGIQGGRVVGATDKEGREIKDRPITVPDLMATTAQCLGLDPGKSYRTPQDRPITMTDRGNPIRELLS